MNMVRNTDPFSPKKVCDLLVRKGLIAIEQAGTILKNKDNVLEQLKKRAESDDSPFFSAQGPLTIIDAIVSMKLTRKDRPELVLDEAVVFHCLAGQWGFEYRKLDPLKLDLNLVTSTIPRSFALKHLVLPVAIQDGTLTVAMANPFNTEVLEDISRASHFQVKPVVSPKTDIIKLIHEFFGFKRSIVAASDQFSGPSVDLGNLEQYVRLKASDELPSNDHHVVNAVNHLFGYAFDQRASDIHIEPKRDTSLVRMRIDGVLHKVYDLPKNVHSAIISRIKNLSRMDMAEKRRPQDGRIKTDKAGVEVEIRISTIPVAFGEKVVMRIMDPDILFQDLEKLGFSTTDLIRFNQFVKMPHGIALVCGPTGSGKSTTLYSTLRDLSSPEINVTTVEDPIEMIHEDFNQIAVQPAVGITFASILRYILRQDPDVIMIGEMRDRETAENAIQAALTGHLVLSTLHTNDAPSAITRLLDLGAPSFLIQNTLVGIMAQRLVRKICMYCKQNMVMSAKELENMGLKTGEKGPVRLSRGKGCEICRYTGYLGRVGVFEVLPYSKKLRQLTTAQTDLETIRAQAMEEGMVSLRENAVKKMLKGVTTYQEVLRVTWENR